MHSCTDRAMRYLESGSHACHVRRYWHNRLNNKPLLNISLNIVKKRNLTHLPLDIYYLITLNFHRELVTQILSVIRGWSWYPLTIKGNANHKKAIIINTYIIRKTRIKKNVFSQWRELSKVCYIIIMSILTNYVRECYFPLS